jgi:hypothetical protein
MSALWFYLAGCATGIVAMVLARYIIEVWWRPRRPTLPPNIRPCLIRVAGDRTWCESCRAQWDTNDPEFSFCGAEHSERFAWNGAPPARGRAQSRFVSTPLKELLACAAVEEKSDIARVVEIAKAGHEPPKQHPPAALS